MHRTAATRVDKAAISRLNQDLDKYGSLNIRVVFEEVFGVTKLSEAVQFMITGLTEALKRDDFIIDMNNFGAVEQHRGKKVCAGCAACCALQELSGVLFTPSFEDRLLWRKSWTDSDFYLSWLDSRNSDGRVRKMNEATSAINTVEVWYDMLRRGGDFTLRALDQWLGSPGVAETLLPVNFCDRLRPLESGEDVEQRLSRYADLAKALQIEGL